MTCTEDPAHPVLVPLDDRYQATVDDLDAEVKPPQKKARKSAKPKPVTNKWLTL